MSRKVVCKCRPRSDGSRLVRSIVAATLMVLAFFFSSRVQADIFGHGENQFELPFVTIGNPGNPGNPDDTTGDPNPAGRVDYEFRIGKYEVPEEAIHKANAASLAAGHPLNLSFRVERGPQKPATSLTWFEVARFVNWLNEDTGASPAYKFNGTGEFQLWQSGDVGFDPNNAFRNSQARYFLPSMDEWYKAAYFDPMTGEYWDYPTGSNAPPTPVTSGTEPGTAVYQQQGPADVMLAGGPSPFGTIGQAGNVYEWEETELDLSNDQPLAFRGGRGGSWYVTTNPPPRDQSSGFRNSLSPFGTPQNGGVRIASVPEPNLLIHIVSVVIYVTFVRNRRSMTWPLS